MIKAVCSAVRGVCFIYGLKLPGQTPSQYTHAIIKIKRQASDTWEAADCGALLVFDRFAVIDRNHTQPVRYKNIAECKNEDKERTYKW